MGSAGEELPTGPSRCSPRRTPGGAADPNARPPLPLFADLEREAFLDLVAASATGALKEERAAVAARAQGGETIYVIVAGKAEVTPACRGQPKRRWASWAAAPSSASSRCSPARRPPPRSPPRSDTEVFEIRREHLNAVAKSYPAVPQVLAEFAQQRMARNLMATSPLFQQMPGVRARRAAAALHLPRARSRGSRCSSRASTRRACSWCSPASWWCRRRIRRAAR